MSETEALQSALQEALKQGSFRALSWKELAQKTFFTGIVVAAVFLAHQSLQKEISRSSEVFGLKVSNVNKQLEDTNKKTDRLDYRIDRSLESLIKPAGK